MAGPCGVSSLSAARSIWFNKKYHSKELSNLLVKEVSVLEVVWLTGLERKGLTSSAFWIPSVEGSTRGK